ncbi:MAG: hypothetical protein AAF694_02415, partial [Bacteroidota bacterium]
KLFVFSNLHIPHGGYTILDDRMKIHAREISFVISFLVPQAAQDLLMGLFKEQSFRLGDRITGIDVIGAEKAFTRSPRTYGYWT